MKQILEVYNESNNPEFVGEQFTQIHWNKHVLFINPQLNGRHFYRYILPYIVMYEFDAWGTAVTSMDKYKPNKEYEPVKIPLTSKQILWADYIVIPFTTIKLDAIYAQLRSINPDVRIVFNVDFNYYKLSKNHPCYEQFSSSESISNIEDNIFYSDIAMVTNSKLSEALLEKFGNELNNTKYKDVKSRVEIACMPIFIDNTLVLENIELEVPELTPEEKAPLRVGIIATNYTWEDINAYKTELKEVQQKLGEKVKFIMIGFDGVDHFTKKSCLPKGFDFEYVPPCTIVHYFKQLRNLQLDMIFVPLRQNEYNMSTENYNKFLEGGIFKVPLMVYDIHPYNQIIKNGQTGIILSKKKEFVERLEFFEKNRDELKRMGEGAYNLVMDNFVYHPDILPIIDQLYSLSSDEKK